MNYLKTTAIALVTGVCSVFGAQAATPPEKAPEMPQRYMRPSGTATKLPNSNRMLQSGKRVLSTNAVQPGTRIMPMNAPGQNQTLAIYGSLLDNERPGIYSYSLSDNTFTPVAISSDLYANGNGLLYDGLYYSFNMELSEMGSIFVTISKYNTQTWVKEGTGYAYFKDTPLDMAVDPVSNRIYGCFPAENRYDTSRFVWAQYNPKTFTRIGITELERAFVAVAADQTGQFYAVDTLGDFYRVNKESGEATKVGATGLQPSPYAQSMVYDPYHGDLYLSVEIDDPYSTGLYTINPSTGRATAVNSYPDGQLFIGMYVPAPQADYNAPAAPTALSAVFEKGSTSGTLTFTMPSATYGGGALSGSLDYVVEMDGKEFRKGTANAGAQVSLPIEVAGGYHHFEVYASNASGKGISSDTTLFVGNDSPVAVSDLKAEAKDDGVHISWTAPSASQNGGYIDPAAITYSVTRNQDGKVVADNLKATEYVDVISGDAMNAWSYTVTPYHAGLAGASAVSNGVVTGSFCTIPWIDDTKSADTWGLYTVHNIHGDKYTWVYDKNRECILVDYDFNNPKDDWLMTPGLQLKSDRCYKLELQTSSKWKDPETFEIKMGQGTDVEDMTTVIMEPLTIESDDHSKPDIIRTHEFYVTVPADGIYNIGIHAISEPQMARLELHYIAVTEAGLATAPAAPSDLKVTPGANGTLNAQVEFTAPSTAINGSAISSLDKAEIWVNGELAKTVNAPAPGAKISENVPTIQGDNTVMVKAYNQDGQGLEAKTPVYTGVVVPDVVKDLQAKITDGGVLLSWTAPTSGEYGGYVDPDKLTYTIIRNDGAILGYDVTGTQYLDDLNGFEVNGQRIVSYQVFARSAAGMGYGLSSNGLVLGDGVYDMPFTESFPGGMPANNTWGISSDTETSWWTTRDGSLVPAYDGDDGQAMFTPHGPSQSSIIYTGRFNLNGCVNPTFSIWYYNDTQSSNKVDVCWTDNYADFHTLDTIEFNKEGVPEGWTQFSVSLKELIDKPFVAFGLRGTSDAENWRFNQYIDLIEVKDALDYNLEMVEFNAPGAISFGNEGTFGGYITNIGSMKAENYTIDLLCNDKVVASTPGKGVPAGSSVTFTLTFTPPYELAPSARFKAVINWDKDQNKANDASEERTVLITTNEFPTVTDLNGERDEQDNVNLTWGAPAPGTTAQRTTEGFEDYIPFIIDGIGPWTLVDIEGEDGTFGITFGGAPVEFMNTTYPHAWQVWNPSKCGMDMATIGMDVLMAHSGNQSLVSFQDVDGLNDDWLISPELSGDAQTVKFWVRTPIPNYGMETFEVYYSDTDTEISSFKKIEGLKEEAFINWEEVAASLPDGAKYFAIRHTSAGKYMLAVDDITFIAKDAPQEPLTVSGYTIYRDDEKLATVPATQTTYADTKAAGADHTYAVTVNYTHGESGYSNIFTSVASGLDGITAGQPVALGMDGAIAVRNARGLKTTVVAADGKMTASGLAASDNEVIAAQPGIYVVSVGDKTFKVVVR